MPNRINELELSFIGSRTPTNGVTIKLYIHTALNVCTCRASKLDFWGSSVFTKRNANLKFWGASAQQAEPAVIGYQIH